MLNLYGSFSVPDVDRVTIYRDDEIPHKFYMATDKPSLLRASDGTPLMDFIAYARDVDNIQNEENPDIERGHMNITVGLHIPDDKITLIRNFLRQKLNQEKTANIKYIGLPIRITEPELGYIPFFLDGTASVNTFNEEMVNLAKASVQPGLSGTAVASFSYDLSQAGTAFFHQALQQDVLPIVATYENLTYVARIPAITIRIEGDRSAIHREFSSKLPKRHIRHRLGRRRVCYYRPKSSTYSEFTRTFQSIKVTIDDADFRADNGDDAGSTAAFEAMAMEIIESQIMPSLFETPELPQEETEDGAKDETFIYLRENTTVSGHIDVTFSKRDVVQMQLAGSGSIGQELTEDEKRDAVTTLDLSETVLAHHRMTIYPNVNFATDPIFALQVIIDYDQMDEIENRRFKKHEEVTFQKDTPPTKKTIRLARNADGSPKTDYTYRTILTYNSTSSIPPVLFPATGSLTENMENLIISYPMLGHMKSTLSIGTWPENVLSADIKVSYPSQPSLPNSEQSFFLSRDNPTGVYLLNTSTISALSSYQVDCTYTLDDGSRITRRLPDQTGQSVIIPSPFDSILKTMFVLSGSTETIQNVMVNAVYEDSANGLRNTFVHALTPAENLMSWDVEQIDSSHTEFTYNVTVFNKDGSSTEQTDLKGQLGETITVGEIARASLEVIIDPFSIDWTVWSRAFVTLEYVPSSGAPPKKKVFRFSESTQDVATWSILVEAAGDTEYNRQVTYIGVDTSRQLKTEIETSDESFFVLLPDEGGAE